MGSIPPPKHHSRTNRLAEAIAVTRTELALAITLGIAFPFAGFSLLWTVRNLLTKHDAGHAETLLAASLLAIAIACLALRKK